MTPAVTVAKKAKIAYTLHSYTHDPANTAYGEEASTMLGIAPERVFKTLVVRLDDKQLVVAVIPVSSMLSMKHLAKAAGGKKADMADGADVERSSGYILGGVSPLGQKKRLRTFIDTSAERYESIFVSAGRRGLEIELAPKDLCRLVNGAFAALSA